MSLLATVFTLCYNIFVKEEEMLRSFPPDPDDLIGRIAGKLKREDWLAFLSSFLIGLLTHAYMFTNKLLGRDELLCLFASNDMLQHGRWLLRFFSAVSSDFSLPWINGMISLISISLTALFVCRILSIRRGWQIVLVSASLVTFPTVANTFSYMFVADAFFVSCLTAVIAVYVTERFRRGWICSILLLTVSMAVYQGYICFAIPLYSLLYLRHLFDPNESDKQHLRVLFRYSLAVLGGILLYIFSTKMILAATGVSLGAGQNLDAMGKLKLSDIPLRVCDAVYYFLEFWVRTCKLQLGSFIRIVNLLMAVSTVSCLFISGIMRKQLSLFSRVLILMILLLTPVLYNTIRLMGASTIHWVMLYSFSLIYVFWIVSVNLAADSVVSENNGFTLSVSRLNAFLAAVCLFVSSFSWSVNANKVYFAMQLYYENCYALAERVVYDAEHTDGYYTNIPMAVEGAFNAGNYIPTKSGLFYSIGMQSALQSANDYILIFDDAHFRIFALNILGFCTSTPDPSHLKKVMKSEEYLSMPYYPLPGSVRVIDGILLVKASD